MRVGVGIVRASLSTHIGEFPTDGQPPKYREHTRLYLIQFKSILRYDIRALISIN